MITNNFKVDIIIPVYGHSDLVEKCVDSVLHTTDPNEVCIILVDDCSPGISIKKLFYDKYESLNNVITAKTNQNLGFLQASKGGAQLGNSEFILFLNSDVEAVEDNWLDKLIPQEKEVAIVGTKLLFPTAHPKIYANKIQHAGVVINQNKTSVNIGHMFLGYDSDRWEVNIKRNLNAVTGACFLVRRSIWNELEGWDNNFNKGVYEDVDFCWRAYSEGYAVIYNPSTYLYHYSSASTSEDGSHSLNIYTKENLQKLIEKWRNNFIFSNLDEFYGKDATVKWQDAKIIADEVVLLAKDNNLAVACKKIEDSISNVPEFYESHLIYAKILSKLNCHSNAVFQLQTALYYNPMYWDARFRLVHELIKISEIELAKYHFNIIDEILPEHNITNDLRKMFNEQNLWR